MAKSILNTEKGRCYICGKSGYTHLHHCIFGSGRRKLADEDGLTVYLCPLCHQLLHDNGVFEMALKQEAQAKWEEVRHYNGHDEFIRRYGRNYL